MFEFIMDHLADIIAWVFIIIMVAIIGLPFYAWWKKGIFRNKF